MSFTGSPEVGREIAAQAARELQEGHARARRQVAADRARRREPRGRIPGIAQGFFGNQGEICAAGTRILVQRELYDDVVAGPRPRPPAPCSSATRSTRARQMGALINAQAARRVTGYIAKGTEEGADARRRRRHARPQGLLRGADGVRRRRQPPHDRPGGDLRAGRARAPVRRAGRGDRDRQRHALRARRLHLDDEPRRGPPLRRARSRPAACGSTAARRPTRACPGAA